MKVEQARYNHLDRQYASLVSRRRDLTLGMAI